MEGSTTKKKSGKERRVPSSTPASQTSGFHQYQPYQQQQSSFQGQYQHPPPFQAGYQHPPYQQGAFQAGYQHPPYQQPYIPQMQEPEQHIPFTGTFSTPTHSFHWEEGMDDDTGTPRVAESNPSPTQEPERDVGPVRRKGKGKEKEKEKEKGWSGVETDLLIKCFMKNTIDSVKGTDKKRHNFWGDVLESYVEAGASIPGIKERNRDQLRCKWKRIAAIMTKWAAAYDQAQDLAKSGESPDDIVNNARTLYEQQHLMRFTMLAEWNILKMYPKWAEIVRRKVDQPLTTSGSGSGSKRPRDQDEGDEFDNIFEASPLERPQGRDAARAARKGKSQATITPEQVSAAQASMDSVTSAIQASDKFEELRVSAADRRTDALNNRTKVLAERNFAKNYEIYRELSAKPNRTELDEICLEEVARKIRRLRENRDEQ